NKLWLGSLYGLYEYNIKKDLLTYHGKYSEKLKTRISDIAVIDSETIACGTRGNGIILYNHKEHSVEAINKKSGLNSHFISTLFLRDSLLWAGTNKGVNIINLQNSDTPVRHLTQSSGLRSDQINKIRMIDSTIYIATSKGVSYFNPDKLVQDTSSLTIYIQEIINFEGPYQEDQSINIPYPKNTIGFRYSPLVYNHNKNLKYRYRIKGLDKKWQYTESNEVFFPFIPSGDYIFEIAVRNKNGIWSKSLTRVPFTIEKPYWRTAWFYVFIGAVVFIFLAVIVLLFINNRKIKNEAQQSIIKYQQYALSNQMNPHFLYNSLNSIHRYLLENNPIYASKYLARFARLMRLFLDNSHQEFISLNKEVEMIEIYLELEKLRMKDMLTYNINIDDKIDPENTFIPAMIIQPFAENAIMHGIRYLQNEKGIINISFEPEKDYLTIAIEDNGVGMARAQELEQKNNHVSYGVNIIKKRLELLNQLYGFNIGLNFIDLHSEDYTSRGTKIIIRNIPIDLKNV
ncbi:MAG: histidine kinase, partial [Bacteroidota bacterium]